MSNILKVTTPTVGYDNSINNKPSPSQQAEDLSIKNPVEANKVGRADGRTESGNNDGGKGVAYDSNFGSFVQSLRDLPKLNEIMSKMIFGGMANIVESGIGKGTAADIQAFFQMLEMSPEKLNEFLKAQMAGANRLQGPLFDVLRQIMDEATTVELKAGVLDLLKKYNDMSSGKHILENIKGTLEEIEARMFRNDRDGLERLAMRLKQHSMDANAANTRLLKEQIIPYMGKYVADNRELGKLRDLVTLVAFNTARYESGNIDNVVQAFWRLMDFPTFRKHFKGMTAEGFREMLLNVDYDRAAGKNELADKLLNIMQAGVKGEAGIENREAFINVMRSMLVNESVYMPLMHVMLPVILDGVPMFSEMWVDPDEESGNPGSDERGVKLLIKFDMKDVGFFDMMLYYEKGKIDMLIHYPEELSGHESDIRDNIRKIMSRNKLELEYLGVEQNKVPIQVSAAFPKIFERRNSINVTI
ncbi:hypothetical protein C817_04948 [Dorea sp. 5-2]|jgi:hypothetical protein|nr:hypothetical protein C817_04948 [Dorea sp. 5-2]MCI9025560.1 hypothetical protein [Dorea sp.]